MHQMRKSFDQNRIKNNFKAFCNVLIAVNRMQKMAQSSRIQRMEAVKQAQQIREAKRMAKEA